MKCSPDKKIVIAVDGFSSCGKSTFAKKIASALGYVFIDTGAMYRAVTLYGIRHGAIRGGVVDAEALERMLPRIGISFVFNPAREASDIYLDGENVEGPIRSLEVSEAVSRVSQIGAVRERLVGLQQQMGRDKGIVMDGRDIGTVVFPDAELKIFMTADPAVRAMRRYRELTAKGEKVSLEEIERNIRERDLADQTRAISGILLRRGQGDHESRAVAFGAGAGLLARRHRAQPRGSTAAREAGPRNDFARRTARHERPHGADPGSRRAALDLRFRTQARHPPDRRYLSGGRPAAEARQKRP